MSKKLNIQSVNAAHQAAADANTKANEALGALRERLAHDNVLAADLWTLITAVYNAVNDGTLHNVPALNRERLEPTANSYGYTLADHPNRRDLVVVKPL